MSGILEVRVGHSRSPCRAFSKSGGSIFEAFEDQNKAKEDAMVKMDATNVISVLKTMI